MKCLARKLDDDGRWRCSLVDWHDGVCNFVVQPWVTADGAVLEEMGRVPDEVLEATKLGGTAWRPAALAEIARRKAAVEREVSR